MGRLRKFASQLTQTPPSSIQRLGGLRNDAEHRLPILEFFRGVAEWDYRYGEGGEIARRVDQILSA
jgi:hypothetical protein